MAWDEGSFLEGAIAGGLAGGTVGAVAAPATVGTSIPIFAVIGAILGGLVKLTLKYSAILILIVLFFLYGLGKVISLPPYLWIIIIIIMALWIFKRK